MGKRVEVRDLQIGMFVSELDRSWLDSPFLFQGFMIDNEDDLGKLQDLCDYVIVDEERSSSPASRRAGLGAFSTRTTRAASQIPSTGAATRFERAYSRTTAAHRETLGGVIKLLDDRRLGRLISADVVRDSVNNLMSSVLADPSAALWLTRMRGEDEFSAAHSMNVATLSLAFARHLNIPEKELRAIGLGALLHDVGLTAEAIKITRKTEDLTSEDIDVLRKHPADGVYSIRRTAEIDPITTDIIRWHHERVDGSGYPDGLTTDRIPRHVLIVGIADTYDAMVSDRAFRRGIPPGQALMEMYRLADITFGKKMMQSFIQCIGVYPATSVVQLNTGAVGIVVASNEDARLLPLLLLLKDEKGNAITPGKFVDLANVERKTGERWFIERFADPAEWNLDPAAINLPKIS